MHSKRRVLSGTILPKKTANSQNIHQIIFISWLKVRKDDIIFWLSSKYNTNKLALVNETNQNIQLTLITIDYVRNFKKAHADLILGNENSQIHHIIFYELIQIFNKVNDTSLPKKLMLYYNNLIQGFIVSHGASFFITNFKSFLFRLFCWLVARL